MRERKHKKKIRDHERAFGGKFRNFPFLENEREIERKERERESECTWIIVTRDMNSGFGRFLFLHLERNPSVHLCRNRTKKKVCALLGVSMFKPKAKHTFFFSLSYKCK